jgi:hypothetical protein
MTLTAASSVLTWARMNVRQASSRGAGGGHPIRSQDLANSGGRDPAAEPAQLALDPYDAPPAVLPGQARHQRYDLVGDPWAPRWLRLAPLRRDQSAMPAQQRARRHDPAPAQRLGRTRASTASTARSGQVIFDFGFPRRRIATSCRSASISASLNAEERASSTSHDNTVVSSRQVTEGSTGTDHGRDKAAGQATGRVDDQHRPRRGMRRLKPHVPKHGADSSALQPTTWPMRSTRRTRYPTSAGPRSTVRKPCRRSRSGAATGRCRAPG